MSDRPQHKDDRLEPAGSRHAELLARSALVQSRAACESRIVETAGPEGTNAKARLNAAKKTYEGLLQQFRADPSGVVIEAGSFRDWSVRWLHAELSQKKADEIVALEGHLERMQLWKEMCDVGVKNGTATRISASVTEFFRLEAEDWLGAAKAEAEKQ